MTITPNKGKSDWVLGLALLIGLLAVTVALIIISLASFIYGGLLWGVFMTSLIVAGVAFLFASIIA